LLEHTYNLAQIVYIVEVVGHIVVEELDRSIDPEEPGNNQVVGS